jgi:hypothetical protein
VTQKKEQRPSELRARLNAKCKEQGVSLERDSKAHFLISYSTLNRHLNLEKDLKPTLINKLSLFLAVSDEEVIGWHGIKQIQPDHTTQQNKKKNKTTTFFSIFASTVVIILVIMVWTQSNASKHYQPITHTSKYSGKGIDIDLTTSAGLEDFHPQLFKYSFSNSVIKITGDDIEFSADVEFTLIDQPEIKYMGAIKASGKYLNGHAAMSYQVTVKPNNEVWLGVLMLNLPDTGPSKGYWLTILNDPGYTSFGDFAFGNIKMDKALNGADKK